MRLAWALVALGVFTTHLGHASEDTPLGVPAGAVPAWASTRAFPTARTYVATPRHLVLHFDSLAEVNLNDSGYSREDTRYGAWWGLGHRLALEATVLVTSYGTTAPLMLNQQTVALRWAWADWNMLWGNPALALSYEANNSAPPTFTAELSLGGGWPLGIWALDLSFTRDLRGQLLAQTYGAQGAVAATWENVHVDVGVEGTLFLTDTSGARFSFEEGLVIAGPYVRWAPYEEASVLLDLAFGEDMKTQNAVSLNTPVIRPKLVLAWVL